MVSRRWMVAVVIHAVLMQVILGAVRPSLAYALLDSSETAGLLGLLPAEAT